MPETTSPPVPPKPDPAVGELEDILSQMLIEHEQLLALAAAHRRALATANPDAVGACLVQQSAVVQRVAELERRRQSVVGRLADRLGPRSIPPTRPPERPTVAWVAGLLSEPVRVRLLALAERLRELLGRLHREHEAIRLAAQTLAAHMDGLMKQVSRSLSHAGTYGRRGSVDSSVQVISALDMTS
jgi:hypothetical protein